MDKRIKKLIPWLGGKEQLKQKIINRMPSHELYVETCFGGGFVFIGKPKSKYEVINDIHSDLINLFWVVRDKPDELLKELRFETVSRELFYRYKAELLGASLNDVQRAKRFFYIIKNIFGALGDSFGVSTTSKARFSPDTAFEVIKTTHERLKGVTIENLDMLKCIDIYDRPHTFFLHRPAI